MVNEVNVGTENPSISVVIVNYNSGIFLVESVRSVMLQVSEVLIVDNASTDESVQEVQRLFATDPSLEIVHNKANLGFAVACNQGYNQCQGDFVLFLNPDCRLKEDAVRNLLLAFQADSDVGMVGGLLVNLDGSEQAGGRRSVPTPWRSLVRISGFHRFSERWPRLFSDFVLHQQPLPDERIDVEAISGACMLVDRKAVDDVGLWDEGYFLHCEDLDWCMRFRQKGWKILFVPDAIVVHHKGGCSHSRPTFVEWQKHKGMIRFYRKFFRHQYPGVMMWLVVVGVWLRFALVAGYHPLKKFRHKKEQSCA